MGNVNRFELDASARLSSDGSVLLGGSPLSMFRLTPAGTRIVRRIESGEELAPGHAALTKRLVGGGAIHPCFDPAGGPSVADVTLVVPAFGADPKRLAELVRRSGCARAIVVDDASPEPVPAIEGAEVVRLTTNGGPGAARQAGLNLVTTALVAFADADLSVGDGWVASLLPCFADESVALVAPRVRAAGPEPTTGWIGRELARFEAVRGPLDLGPRRGRIRSGTRISYVPAAALVCRVSALRSVGGFDLALRLGEDVDLEWRLDEAGWSCRYEPATEVHHDVRPTLSAWLRQRAGYGFSATDLALRHPGSVAPIQMSGWSATAWGLGVLGLPVVGAAVAAGSTAVMARKLPSSDDRTELALRIAGLGHLHAGKSVADALVRSWWPASLCAALVSRRVRRVLAVAAVLPALIDWWRVRARIDPVRYLSIRLLDDGSYGFGLWRGAIARRSGAALRPAIRVPKRRSGSAASGAAGRVPPVRG